MCQDISKESGRVLPGNYFLNVSAQSLTKLGDAIINPKVTLPWLLSAVGAPGWMEMLVRGVDPLVSAIEIKSFQAAQEADAWRWLGGRQPSA